MGDLTSSSGGKRNLATLTVTEEKFGSNPCRGRNQYHAEKPAHWEDGSSIAQSKSDLTLH